MNIDRMNALLGNIKLRAEVQYQGIFPEVGFTCNGRVLSWVFGAMWEGFSGSFAELQIWRPAADNDGVFVKVWSTQIMTSENQSELYYYPLTTPLAFQAGDVLGYFQPSPIESPLRLLYEWDERGLQVGYYYRNLPSSPNTLNIRRGEIEQEYQMLINVIAGEY